MLVGRSSSTRLATLLPEVRDDSSLLRSTEVTWLVVSTTAEPRCTLLAELERAATASEDPCNGDGGIA